LYSIAQRYTAGQSFEPMIFTKSDKEGFPELLEPFRPFLEGNANQRIAALTVLSLYKLIETENSVVDLSSIVEGEPVIDMPPIKEGITYFDKYASLNPTEINLKIASSFKHIVNSMFPTGSNTDRIDKINRNSTIHISSKNGPNGPALETASMDFIAIRNSKLFDRICRLADITKNIPLQEVIGDFFNHPPTFLYESYNTCTSKLSLKQESGGKNRIFAIGDYFTQSALKGFHTFLFSFLRGLPQDGTHNQNYVSQIAKEWSEDEIDDVYSIDLSKATDRLPALVLGDIVMSIYNKAFANLWFLIMTDRDFVVPGEPGKTVKYAVGQPMGLYSSWAMLAVWHHIICRMCLHILDIPISKEKAQYLVIGDDVVMRGKRVAELYCYIVTNILGIEVSPVKGFSPETKVQGRCPLSDAAPMKSVEVAKRIFVDGIELSPISPVLIRESMRFPHEFPNLFIELEEKGTILPSYPQAIWTLSRYCKQPTASIEAATFPLSPAPSGVVLNEDGTMSWPLQGSHPVYWFSNPEMKFWMIYSIFGKYLRRNGKLAIAKFEETAQRYVEATQSHIWDLKKGKKIYKFKSDAQSRLLIKICKMANISLNRLFTEYTGLIINYESGLIKGDIDLRIVRRQVGKLQVILELESVLDKSKNRYSSPDAQKFSSRTITKVAQGLKYFFGLPGSISDNIHMFDNIKPHGLVY
jgi:hypothetical protein